MGKAKKEEKWPKVGVGVFVFNNKLELLLQKRKGTHGHGEWSLPGGKVDWFEDAEDSAVRETKEEVGIKINKKDLVFVTYSNDRFPKHDKHFVTLFYSCFYKGKKKPYNAEPHKAYSVKWFDIDKLPKPLFPPLKRALKKTDMRIYPMGQKRR